MRIKTLLFLLLPVLAFGQWDGANTVSNGDFASDLTDWDVNASPATHEWVETFDGKSGVIHIVSNGTPNVEGTVQDLIPVVTGDSIRIKYDVHVVSGACRFDLTTQANGGLGMTEVETTTGSWIAQEFFLGISTEGVTSVKAFFRSTATGHEFYVDNVEIIVYVAPTADADTSGTYSRYKRYSGFKGW